MNKKEFELRAEFRPSPSGNFYDRTPVYNTLKRFSFYNLTIKPYEAYDSIWVGLKDAVNGRVLIKIYNSLEQFLEEWNF